jgi:hypothetical protein
MTPGNSAISARLSAISYMPNAKLAIVKKPAKDIAPTFDADQAASNAARIIAGEAIQIFRRLDAIALQLWALRLTITETQPSSIAVSRC